MATYRIGEYGDLHYKPSDSESAIIEDFDYLYNTLGCDKMVLGGDNYDGDYPHTPHMPESHIRGLWEDVIEQVPGGMIDETHAIPGNHDIPTSFHEEIGREYIGDRAETPQELRPIDGLTILLFDTVGAKMQGGDVPAAMTEGYVPYNQIQWLHQKVQEAHSRSDITILIGHHPIYFADTTDVGSYHHYSGGSFSKMYHTDTNSYYVVMNFKNLMNYLTDAGTPLIYISNHDADVSSPYYTDLGNISGVLSGIHHTWQKHLTQFSYIDVDTSTGRVQYTVVNEGDAHGENTIMDVTPNW